MWVEPQDCGDKRKLLSFKSKLGENSKTFQVIGFGAMGAASTATAVAIQCVI